MCLQGWEWRDLQCSHQTLTGPWNSRPELPSGDHSCPSDQDTLSPYKTFFLSITFSVIFVSITFYVSMFLLPNSHIALHFVFVTIFIYNRFKCSIIVNHDFEANVLFYIYRYQIFLRCYIFLKFLTDPPITCYIEKHLKPTSFHIEEERISKRNGRKQLYFLKCIQNLNQWALKTTFR